MAMTFCWRHRSERSAHQAVSSVSGWIPRRAVPGFEKRRNEQIARKDFTYFQNPVNEAAVLIAVEIWKLLDRLGPDGDMQGRIKDFEELGDEERGSVALKASLLVQGKLSRWPDDGDPLMREFARASEGSAGTDA